MNPLTRSYYSGASTAQIIYETIGSYFDKIAELHSTNSALIVRHQGINWTYGELQAQVNRLAMGLIHLGIEPGDRVGIWGPNSSEWVFRCDGLSRCCRYGQCGRDEVWTN